MESTPRHEILEFNDDTLSYLRKQYNYDKPGEMDAAIDLLDDWVKKQPHFINKEYSREYLERRIILSKGSVERAKEKIEKLSTLKTLMPQAFQHYDAKNDFKGVIGVAAQATLPKLTNEQNRVHALKFLDGGIITSKTLLDTYRYAIMFTEYWIANDYFNGIIGIIDYRSINVSEILSALNLFDLNEFLTIITSGYTLRIKNIHLISNSKLMDVLIGIHKKALGPKIGNRVHHHIDIETLHQYVPKYILPVEFGGTERSFQNLSDEWMELFSSNENREYFKKVFKYGTDEKYRDKAKFNEMYMGVSGSFRNLHVD